MELMEIFAMALHELLRENKQLADKVYFRTGKLTEGDRENILDITGGDNYTKIISDFYFEYKKMGWLDNIQIVKNLRLLYYDIKDYNKNVFPIVGYDIQSPLNVLDMIYGLQKRRKIIELIKKLPSFATRNMKDDIRKERSNNELGEYFNNLDYFISHYKLLSNRDEKIQGKILRKMFKSNTTLGDLMRFVDDKSNFIGGVEFTKKDVKKLSYSEDFEIIYEQGDIMIVRVDSPNGIKAIGCNSLWCFTYGSGFDAAYRQWNNYSYNDIVYVIIDFSKESDSEDFMYVLIKPLTDKNGDLISYDEDNEDEHPLYNMSNENYTNPYYILEGLFGNNYESIIHNYLNFESY